MLANVLTSAFHYGTRRQHFFISILPARTYYRGFIEEAVLCLRQCALLGNGSVTGLCSASEEDRWRALADSGQPGVSTEELIELLMLIDESAASAFVKEVRYSNAKTEENFVKQLDRYLEIPYWEGSSFLEFLRNKENRSSMLLSCLQKLSMKRRLRVAVALFTSHNRMPSTGWEPLLRGCVDKLFEAEKVLSRLLSLSVIDQELVIPLLPYP